MSNAKHAMLLDLFSGNGLTDGYKLQQLVFIDSNDLSDRFMVFRPSGGTNVDAISSSQYFVDVILVSASGVSGEYERSFNDVSAIIDFVCNNAYVDACLGQVTNMGGIPSPTMTSEGRMVWMLQFSCLYGRKPAPGTF